MEKEKGFNKGNQFWKLRSKHGRDKIFATPEILWDSACEYFEWCDNNPWKEKDWVGKDAIRVERETQRPYTLTALCIYLGVNTQYFTDFKETCSKDFSLVITRIEEIIKNMKYEGAVVGAFNANIISRDLGLIDKKEQALNGTVTITGMEIK
jgi:hypothetical protein